MKFYVTVEYLRADGTSHDRVFEIDRCSASAAANAGRMRFKADDRHRNSSISRVRATPAVPTPTVKVYEPDLIRNGDRITVPITGTVELETGGTCILTGTHGARIRLNAQQVERHTGRRLAPVERVEYWSVYPNGNVYQSDRRIKNSQYDLDTEIVQIKVMKVNGKIVRKEFV
jgi:hypothetical protein